MYINQAMIWKYIEKKNHTHKTQLQFFVRVIRDKSKYIYIYTQTTYIYRDDEHETNASNQCGVLALRFRLNG